MQRCAVSRIEVEPSGRLLVAPSGEGGRYEYVYREANGLRWDAHARAFYAYEPSKWAAGELVLHIASTLRQAIGVELYLAENTEWVNVPSPVRHEILQALRSV
jgi:hypothetical protein